MVVGVIVLVCVIVYWLEDVKVFCCLFGFGVIIDDGVGCYYFDVNWFGVFCSVVCVCVVVIVVILGVVVSVVVVMMVFGLVE